MRSDNASINYVKKYDSPYFKKQNLILEFLAKPCIALDAVFLIEQALKSELVVKSCAMFSGDFSRGISYLIFAIYAIKNNLNIQYLQLMDIENFLRANRLISNEKLNAKYLSEFKRLDSNYISSWGSQKYNLKYIRDTINEILKNLLKDDKLSKHIKNIFIGAKVIVDQIQIAVIKQLMVEKKCDSISITKPEGYLKTKYIKMSMLMGMRKKYNCWFPIEIKNNIEYLLITANEFSLGCFVTIPKGKIETSKSGANKLCEYYDKGRGMLYFKLVSNNKIINNSVMPKQVTLLSQYKYLYHKYLLIKMPKQYNENERLKNQRSGLLVTKNLGDDLFLHCSDGIRKLKLLQFRKALLEMDIFNSKGLVHRDAKPENSIINQDGNVYFIDFDDADYIENFRNRLVSLQTKINNDVFKNITSVKRVLQGTCSYMPKDFYDLVVKYLNDKEMFRRVLVSADLYGNLLTILMCCTNYARINENTFDDIPLYTLKKCENNYLLNGRLERLGYYIETSIRQLYVEEKNLAFRECRLLLTDLYVFINQHNFDKISNRKYLLGLRL